MTDVVVVGAGIVGASVAYHLAAAGAGVALIDAALPGTGATSASFGWIGVPAGGDLPDVSTALRRTALAEWDRLEARLDGVRVHRTGAVVWGDGVPPAGGALAPGERLLDAAGVAALEPSLRRPPASAVHRTSDAWVDPAATTEALVAGARALGARVLPGTAATGLDVRGGRVRGVSGADGVEVARTVVLAAGVATAALCAAAGRRLAVASSPAVLVRLTAPAGLVRTLVSTGEVDVRGDGEGRLAATAAWDGGTTRASLRRTGEEVRRRIAAAFAVEASALGVDEVLVGARPMPADGLPAVGPLPGVEGAYVAVTHAGVTLGATVGRLVAQELAQERPAPELAGLGPGRAPLAGTGEAVR